jgi:hypothetical protein
MNVVAAKHFFSEKRMCPLRIREDGLLFLWKEQAVLYGSCNAARRIRNCLRRQLELSVKL